MFSIHILLIFSCLLLTGYSNDFYNISLPGEINALAGSCVQIPCSFYISDFSDKLRKSSNSVHGVWIKHKSQFEDNPPVFNGTTNLTRGFRLIELVGNLSQSNCTTVFHGLGLNHSDSYFFRIEMLPFRATFRETSVNIVVKDSPQKPNMTSVGEVKEGTTVTLTCSVDAPCPKFVPVLSWSSPLTTGEPLTQFRQNVDKTTSLFSNLTITVSYTHHMINISCNVTYPTESGSYTSAETTMIRVVFSPKETKATIEPPHPVPVGSNVSLSCQSRANPTVDNYTWYREGEQTPKGFGSRIIMSVTAEDQGQYYCQATNTQGSQNSPSVLLAIEGQSESKVMMYIGYAGGAAVLLLLCVLIVCVIRGKKSKKSDMKKEKNPSQEEENPSQQNEEQDEIHYGEIDFSKLQTKNTSGPNQKPEAGSETEYAEVKGLQTKRPPETGREKEDVYSVVKKT